VLELRDDLPGAAHLRRRGAGRFRRLVPEGRVKAWFNRAFRLEEINGGNVCPTYLYRWTLLRLEPFQVYLHHFVGDDWSTDQHDHPKRFISIGLRGGYVEETPAGERRYRAPWIRTFPAEHIHRLRLEDGRDCWTVVIVLRAVRPWGFWRDGQFVPWRQYVNSPDARDRRACP
jgi:hypothetical protein